MNILKGYLSYLLAVCAFVYGIYELAIGNQEMGVTAIYTGLTVFGIRRAIN